MKKLIATTIALVAGLMISTSAMATVPDVIPVQGVLADADDAPVDGLVDITFTLYTAETLGTALWTDTFLDVDVDMGFFTVYLGSDDALDFSTLLTNDEIWLGVAVESDPEMNRIPFYTVPFAIEAQVCERVGSLSETDINTNFASATHTHDSDYLAVDYVPSWNDLTDVPSGFADNTDDGFTTEAELTALLDDNYAALAHGHDDQYYTESEVDTLLAGKSDTSHNHDGDYVPSSAPAAGITSTQITNWDTAYGWGDHASAGYLTSYTETDPVFGASAAAGITATNVTNWNTAYGWGDHASAGYLTSYTETDPVFGASPAAGITATNVTNWNTAYSWGNHAGLYSPISHNHDSVYVNEGQANSITSAMVVDNSLVAADLAADSVGASELANNSVASANIIDGTITYLDTNVNSVQRRVTGTCAAGSSIRAITNTGTVTCETDDTGGVEYAAAGWNTAIVYPHNVSSITHSGTGYYTINFAAGTFSGNPICTCSPHPNFGGTNISCENYFGSSTSTNVYLYINGSTRQDGGFSVICVN